MVQVGGDYRLWVEDRGNPEATPLLLIMGANASGLAWPESLVDRLTERHRVVRYDHRDTGRSTSAFDTHPYAVRDLAEDALAVLDAVHIDRAHVVGMSLGGILVQLLLLDYPHRLRSATVFATCALGVGLADPTGQSGIDLPEPDPRLLALWQHLADERDRAAEIDWRVEHWRILNGTVLPFDAEEFRELEERIIAHSGTVHNPAAHARADPSGLNRAGELARVQVPTHVIEAPEDPINPPPHATHLAATLGGARLTTIPGMGHALNSRIIQPLAETILKFTGEVDKPEQARPTFHSAFDHERSPNP
ncbi:MAG: alpha/beta hydrolase [Pseudonocardiales bacterium]|nr:alpha/beta hydrolase [Pseudonocardiales bacterium]MBV9143536.1 alpha/beta hydrolase [Pseudonocardiales bacterium]